MTAALFLHPLQPFPPVGATVLLDGPEGRHAARVKRLQRGEPVLLADGAGRGVRGEVVAAEGDTVSVRVAQELTQPPGPWQQLSVVQALPKGDRAELAVEVLTEVGVDEIVPWQAARSIVRWQGERGERSRARWQAAAREAAKQSRRLRVPTVAPVLSTPALARWLSEVDQVLVLHEEATTQLAEAPPEPGGTLALVVGPEGGISPEELTALQAVGARTVGLGETVLRTSTAGLVAVAQLLALARR